MPKLRPSGIPHFVVTDHRIVRDPDSAPAPFKPRTLSADEPPVISFYDGLPEANTLFARRNRAIACSRYLLESGINLSPSATFSLLSYAQKTLGETVRQHPGDVVAASYYAALMANSGRPEVALSKLQDALKRSRDSEPTLSMAAEIAAVTGRHELALEYFKALKTQNPYFTAYRKKLIELYFVDKNWNAIIEEARFVIQHNPIDKAAHQAYVLALRRTGRAQEAAAAFEKLLKMRPKDAEELHNWWSDQ
jgi:tetratricopeptide (TPR) repeat protein